MARFGKSAAFEDKSTHRCISFGSDTSALVVVPTLTPPALDIVEVRGMLLSTNNTGASATGKAPLRKLLLGNASEYDAIAEEDTCCCCERLEIVLPVDVDVSSDPSALI